jgi:metal-responsive CopG/Arc/MetJ family transcriptional regulator
MFTKEVCFFTTDQMYADLKKLSKKGVISVSHLIRTAIREFLESELNDEGKPQENCLVSNEEGKTD